MTAPEHHVENHLEHSVKKFSTQGSSLEIGVLPHKFRAPQHSPERSGMHGAKAVEAASL
jgi:hypothetical protein